MFFSAFDSGGSSGFFSELVGFLILQAAIVRIEDSANLAYHFLLFCDNEDFPRFSDCFFVSLSAQAQLLIVAVFGDELNSGKIEFGLDGGDNRS